MDGPAPASRMRKKDKSSSPAKKRGASIKSKPIISDSEDDQVDVKDEMWAISLTFYETFTHLSCSVKDTPSPAPLSDDYNSGKEYPPTPHIKR